MLHVITRLDGGSGGNTLLSASGMDPRRYEVWLAGGSGGSLWEDAVAAGIRTSPVGGLVEPISPRRDVVALIRLVRLIRRERFAIVHTHSSKAGFLGRVAARLAGTPIVVHTFHGFAYHDFMGRARRRAYIAFERFARRLAHRYFAVSPRVAREAVEMRLAPPGHITVIPSSVSLEGIPTQPDGSLRSALGLPTDRPIVGTVGRIVSQKAPLDFVRMAAHVRDARPDVTFVMVGDATFQAAPLEAATRAEAARLGVDVRFTGFHPEAPAIAALFDVFVISSLYEGLGRALTEAMASGRPVVATAVNGVPDLVEPGATGLLARPGDPADLARAVIWLLDHPVEARRMGEQGRIRALALCDPKVMCDLLDREYANLLGQPPVDRSVEQAVSDGRNAPALQDGAIEPAELAVSDPQRRGSRVGT